MMIHALAAIRREERRLTVAAASMTNNTAVPPAVVRHVEGAILELRDAAQHLEGLMRREAAQ